MTYKKGITFWKIIKSLMCLLCAAALAYFILYLGTGGFGKVTTYDDTLSNIATLDRAISWDQYLQENNLLQESNISYLDLGQRKKLIEKQKYLAQKEVLRSQFHEKRWQKRVEKEQELLKIKPPFMRKGEYEEIVEYIKHVNREVRVYHYLAKKESLLRLKYLNFMLKNFKNYGVNEQTKLVEFLDKALQNQYKNYQEELAELERILDMQYSLLTNQKK